MKYRKHSSLILLLSIFLLGFFLRLYNVTNIPPGLNRDEASIGYTAYSLLETGKDEWGVSWPLSLQSFGDWKLPLYIYITIPSVLILGLTELSVRLPSVIFGSLTILLCYYLSYDIFKKEKIALLSSLILALSPWHVFFSRVTSEANLAVFFVSLGLLLLLKGGKRLLLFIPGSLILSVSLYTYHGNHVFTILFFSAFIILFRKQFMTKAGVVAVVFFTISSAVIFGFTLFGADQTKISGLLSINDESLVYENVIKNRLIHERTTVGRLFNNKYVFFVENIAHSYIKAFSPQFLFISGGGNSQHNIENFGNLYLTEMVFLLVGIYYLLKNRTKKTNLLLVWFLIAPVGASLTKDAPHSARQFAVFPGISLIIGYGLFKLIRLFKTHQRYVVLGVILVFALNISLFLDRYFILFPHKEYTNWGGAYKELVEKIVKLKNEYDTIIVSRPDYSPYIYYLFHQKSDPSDVQTNLTRYDHTGEGFAHVKQYDGVTYKKITWSYERLIPEILFIDWAEGVPPGATNTATLVNETLYRELQVNGIDEIATGSVILNEKVDEVRDKDGVPIFFFIGTKRGSTYDLNER